MKLVLAPLAVAGVAVIGFLAPSPALAAGPRVSADRFTVRHVAVADSTKGGYGENVKAAPGNRFVIFDIRVAGPIKDVDGDDFQLVKEKVSEIGKEQNIGDNTADDYFFWQPLDEQGRPVESVPADARDVGFRLSFQVPQSAKSGYLFYWGAYIGPFQF